MLRFVDLSYYTHKEADIRPVIKKIRQIFTYLVHLQHKYDIRIIQHAQAEQTLVIEGQPCIVFKGKKGFWRIPRKTHNYIADFNPDVVLIQGLIFPLQAIFLRWKLGKKPVFIVQHHGESRYRNQVKTMFQRLADRCVDAYIFTSVGTAEPWIASGVISNRNKCYEVLEGTTPFKQLDKAQCKQDLGITGDWNFIWVGRLNANKDPLAVLEGFDQYMVLNPAAKLYMIYQLDDLLPQVKQRITQSERLQNGIVLVGSVSHDDLPVWYSAMDFYISGSHMESAGFALMESMACGCIPVITTIPAYTVMTGNGACALMYQPGNVASLYQTLRQTLTIDKEAFSRSVVTHFQTHLSFEGIASRIDAICRELIARKR